LDISGRAEGCVELEAGFLVIYFFGGGTTADIFNHFSSVCDIYEREERILPLIPGNMKINESSYFLLALE
jgi:hypothetical protein